MNHTYEIHDLLPQAGRIAIDESVRDIMRQARRRDRLTATTRKLTRPTLDALSESDRLAILLRKIEARACIDTDDPQVHADLTKLDRAQKARFDATRKRWVPTALGRREITK